MEKVIRDGKVAVLVSKGYGAGWYTWNESEELLFHPKLVEMVESGNRDQITEAFVNTLGLKNLGAPVNSLEIEWVEQGAIFTVVHNDGYESIITIDNLHLTA